MSYNIRTSDNKIKTSSTISDIKSPVNGTDNMLVRSYQQWIYGLDAFSHGNKFDTLAYNFANDLTPTGDSLQLIVYYAQINGIGIPYNSIDQTYSVLDLEPEYIGYADVGYGTACYNYTDWIHDLFNFFNIKTRLYTTGNGNGYRYIADFYRTDNFSFIFKETGQVDGTALPTTYYRLGTLGGVLSDSISAIYYNSGVDHSWELL